MASTRTALGVGITVVLTATLMGLAMLALARPGNPGPPTGGGGSPEFEISGSVAPVYPLADASLALKVENPQPFEILVTELEVIVGDASPTCRANNLRVVPVATPFQVPADGESTVETSVRLTDDAADDCQNAVFPLSYVGHAIRP